MHAKGFYLLFSVHSKKKEAILEWFKIKSRVNVWSFAFLSLKTTLKSSQSYNEVTKTLISQLIFPSANVVVWFMS